MAKDKSSFVLYADQEEIFDYLSDEQAGQLIKTIFKYVNDENPTPEDPFVKMGFITIKQTLKRDLKKWENKLISKSNAGKMSAAKNKFDKYKIKILADLKETDFDFELMYFTESKKDYKSTDYMYMYFDLCINFLLQHKPTKSTPVESVEVCSTKSTVNVNVNDSVNVNGSVIVNDNVNEIKQIPVFSFRKELLSLCDDKLIIDTFLKIRKKKKAVNSQIAFNSIKKEIDKSNLGAKKCLEICCEKSWGSFKFEWLENMGYGKATNNRNTSPPQHDQDQFD